MKGPNTLIQAEDSWQTDMGAWFSGERVVFRGKDLFTELNDFSWFKLLMLGITGREFNDNQIKLFEAIWVLSTSYPEPRIWNNRVSSLSGTAKSTGALASSASTAISEATIYGGQSIIAAIDFIQRAKKIEEDNGSLSNFITEDLKKNRAIAGYGRPIIQNDERIKPLYIAAKALGFDSMPYIELAFRVEKILIDSRYRLKMNIAGLVAALISDQKLTPREHYYFTMLVFSGGSIPCFIDAVNKPEGSFFPLSCERLNYKGNIKRHW
jgi:citrate synthase